MEQIIYMTRRWFKFYFYTLRWIRMLSFWFGFICMYKCFCSVAKLCPTLCGLMDCCTPGFSVLHYLPEFAQTRVHWVGDAFQPSHALMPPSPPAVHLSQIRVFSNVLALQIRWLKNWSFSISPSNEYSGLIFFRIDCFDLLAVQGTLKNLLQHHSLKVSILRHSAFFMVQLSHPYMTPGKTNEQKIFCWSIVDLQCCVNFCCTAKLRV